MNHAPIPEDFHNWPFKDRQAFFERDDAKSPDQPGGVCLEDFHAYMPMHSYIFSPSCEMWPASSVNARIPPIAVGDRKISASTWLDQHKPVEQMTWAPGEPMLMRDRLIADGGW